jgi:serine-type D-Ala-D-Ala carboxypeptidase (penicillin-binding protein 5/6)
MTWFRWFLALLSVFTMIHPSLFLNRFFKCLVSGAGVASLSAGLLTQPAFAQVPAPQIQAKSWLLVDMASGQTLTSQDADAKVAPASLTKLMTAYLVFSALKDGRLKMDQRPTVSSLAYKAEGSRMFVDPAKPATVEELLSGMIIQSGNDATIILAEAVAGTESGFVELMNKEAKKMALSNTQYRNSSGLPDAQHYSSARDLALLAQALIRDFPDRYPLYSRKEYKYNDITQPNRNRLLFIDPTVDGLKTGHTEAAGFCLVASARRDQGGGVSRRLLSVLLGASSESARAIESQKLLNFGFQNYEAVKVFSAATPAGQYRVWKGQTEQIAGGFMRDVMVTVPKGMADKVKAEITRTEPLLAPIAKDQKIGVLRVKLDDKVLAERDLVALAAAPQAGWFGRTWDSLRLMIGK